MAAKRISRSAIDWEAFSKVVPSNQTEHFNKFKAMSTAYLIKMQQLPENPPAINWSYYSKHMTNSAMLKDFQTKYENIKIPYPEDKLSAEVDAQSKSIVDSVEQFVSESKQRVGEFEVKLENWKHIPPLTEMTMEEVYMYIPEVINPLDSIGPHTEDANDYDE